MKKLLFIVTLLLLGCAQNGIEKPKNLISEQRMKDILYDLSLLEAMKSQSPQTLSNAVDPSHYIYKKYAIDSLQFAQSNRYYAADLKKYQSFYDEVSKKLGVEKAKYESVKTPSKANLPDHGTIK